MHNYQKKKWSLIENEPSNIQLENDEVEAFGKDIKWIYQTIRLEQICQWYSTKQWSSGEFETQVGTSLRIRNKKNHQRARTEGSLLVGSLLAIEEIIQWVPPSPTFVNFAPSVNNVYFEKYHIFLYTSDRVPFFLVNFLTLKYAIFAQDFGAQT